MRTLAPALALALALVLAGCLSSDEPMETAAVEQAAVGADAAAPVANATAQMVAEEGPVPATVPIAYTGNTGMGACVFAAGVCEFAQPGSEDEHVFEGIVGKPVHVVATFTFPEQKPGMSFYVGFCSGPSAEEISCGDYQSGASPYLREFDLRQDPVGTIYGFSVGSLNPATEAAGLIVFMDSPFEVAGEFHVLR